jgi:hypothetical protein
MQVEVARRLQAEPALLERARATLRAWTESGRIGAYYAAEWARRLERPVSEVSRFIGEDTELARSLRQSSPFVGIVPARTRWSLWRDVRRRSGR